MSEMKTIGVIGAGTMGNGIAHVFAKSGFAVRLCEVEQRFLDRGMETIKKNLGREVSKGKLTQEEADAALRCVEGTLARTALTDCDLIVEAATERLEVKRQIFDDLDQLAKPEAILASNTSSISITRLAAFTNRPERVIGMHFFNPPQLMPLVEIVRGKKTSDETVDFVRSTAAKMGKDTVLCKKDSPGFIVNRVLVPALNEAVFLVQEGVADPEDVDKAVKLGLNWPMGPLTLLDYVGLDTTFNITQVFMEEFQDSKYRPSPLLREMVRAGQLGRKSGKGFYEWGSPGATKTK